MRKVSLQFWATPIVILLLATASIYIISEGLTRINARLVLERAQENWNAGHLPEATTEFIRAIVLTVDGGLRMQIAKVYQAQSDKMCKQGDSDLALENCSKAVNALNGFWEGYDNEGEISFRCFLIEERMQNPDLPPVCPPPSVTERMP